MSQHVHTIKRVNIDRFHDEQYRVRRDFDKIFGNPEATTDEVNAMLDKYEHFIEMHFEPYIAMHESRAHSNLWVKMVLWGDDALKTDYVGFYSKNNLVNSTPTAGHFHEQYPHQVQAWMYDENYINTDFNYDDVEAAYAAAEKSSAKTPADLKKDLDESHL